MMRCTRAAAALSALIASAALAQAVDPSATPAVPESIGAAGLVDRLDAGAKLEGLPEGRLEVGPLQVIALPSPGLGQLGRFYARDPRDQTLAMVEIERARFPSEVKVGDVIGLDLEAAYLVGDLPAGKTMLGLRTHRVRGPLRSAPVAFVDLRHTRAPLESLWGRLVRIEAARVSKIGETYPEGCDNATVEVNGRKERACFPDLAFGTSGFTADLLAVVEFHPNPDPLYVLFVVDIRGQLPVKSIVDVQAAIDAAGPGDVVVIEKGEYRGGFRVSDKESLTVKGQGSWFKLDSGARTIIEIRGSKDITLEGIKAVHDVQSCTTGGVLSITDSDRVTIRDAYLDGTGLYGARISRSRDVAIEDSTLTNCIASGLIVEGSSRVSSRRNVIAQNGKRELKYYHDHPGDVAGIEIRKSDGVDIVRNTVVANRFMPGVRNVESKKVRVSRSILFANEGPPVVGDPAETKQRANFLQDPHFADLSTGDFRLRTTSPLVSRRGRAVSTGARPVAADLSGPAYCPMPANKCRGIAPFAYSADGKLGFLTWGGPAAACGEANVFLLDANTGRYLHHQGTETVEPGCPGTTTMQSWAATQAGLGAQIAKHGMTCRADLACHELPGAIGGGPEVTIAAAYRNTKEAGDRAYEVVLYLKTEGRLSRAIGRRYQPHKLEVDGMNDQLSYRPCHALIALPTKPARDVVACLGQYEQDLFLVPASAMSTRGLRPNCYTGPRPGVETSARTWATHLVDATAPVNLRQEPSLTAKVLEKVAPGSKVRSLQEVTCHQVEVEKDLPGGKVKRVRAPWYRVDTTTAVGWLHGAFLVETGDDGSRP